MRILILFTLATITNIVTFANPMIFKPEGIYSNGKLEVSAIGMNNYYWGEFDNLNGNGLSLQAKYTLKEMPNLAFGAKYSNNTIQYLRAAKPRFSEYFNEVFTDELYLLGGDKIAERSSDVNSFELMSFYNLFPEKQLNFYVSVGIGISRITPKDIMTAPKDEIGQRLAFDDFKIEDEFIMNFTAGFGFDYYLTRDLSLGLQTNFRAFGSDMLDGFAHRPDGKQTRDDYFIDYGIKISYSFFHDNDFDGDGISNLDEIASGVNPYRSDSDGDGISDDEEINIWKSNPMKKDTDSDGLQDQEEISYRTDLNNSDTDSDGLNDFDEIFVHHSYPTYPDSDLDGIGDAKEISLGLSATNVDSDGDGFWDSEDKCPSVFGLRKYSGCPQTEPIIHEITKIDTVIVVREISNLSGADYYKPYGINFQKSSSEILVESEIILDDFASWLKENKIIIEIHGHTDNDGDNNNNKKLSLRRAKSVKSYLVKNGISSDRIHVRGFGASRPLDLTYSKKAKAKNRRIEFVLIDKITAK
jgi:outer membrane protein OmpA-like peptidoglycan-associated protein